MKVTYITLEKLIGNERIIEHGLQQFEDLNIRIDPNSNNRFCNKVNSFSVCRQNSNDKTSYKVVGKTIEELIEYLKDCK